MQLNAENLTWKIGFAYYVFIYFAPSLYSVHICIFIVCRIALILAIPRNGLCLWGGNGESGRRKCNMEEYVSGVMLLYLRCLCL